MVPHTQFTPVHPNHFIFYMQKSIVDHKCFALHLIGKIKKQRVFFWYRNKYNKCSGHLSQFITSFFNLLRNVMLFLDEKIYKNFGA